MLRKMVMAIGCLVLAAQANAQDSVFNALSQLNGEWESVESEDGQRIELTYEIAANGFSVVEDLFGMVTVYHLDGDRVLATHYCSAGNQPRMVAPLMLDENRSVTFEFLDVTGDTTNGYINSVSFEFVSPHRFIQKWTYYNGSATADAGNRYCARSGRSRLDLS